MISKDKSMTKNRNKNTHIMIIKYIVIFALSITLCKYKAERISSSNDKYDLHMLTKPLTKYSFSQLTFPHIYIVDYANNYMSRKDDIMHNSIPG